MSAAVVAAAAGAKEANIGCYRCRCCQAAALLETAAAAPVIPTAYLHCQSIVRSPVWPCRRATRRSHRRAVLRTGDTAVLSAIAAEPVRSPCASTPQEEATSVPMPRKGTPLSLVVAVEPPSGSQRCHATGGGTIIHWEACDMRDMRVGLGGTVVFVGVPTHNGR